MKKLILTESQVLGIIEEQMLSEGRKSLYDAVFEGLVTAYMACLMIQNLVHVSQQRKEQLKAQVVAAAEKGGQPIDEKTYDLLQNQNGGETQQDINAQAKEKKDTVDNSMVNPKDWKEITNNAVVTVYNAVPEQCNNDVGHTASMFNLDLDNPASHRIVALERTFAEKHGLKFGDLIYIKGTYKGRQDGVYQYQDRMNKRFAGMDKVDVLVNNDTTIGGTAKNTTAKVYVLNNPEKKAEYMQNMAPQITKN